MFYFLYFLYCLHIRPPVLQNVSSWLSKTSKAFSVRVPQFDITDLPGTWYSLLWILGSNCIFPKAVGFLCSIVKYLSCFSVILSFCLRPLKILLCELEDLSFPWPLSNISLSSSILTFYMFLSTFKLELVKIMCNGEKTFLSQVRYWLKVFIYVLIVLVKLFHFAWQYLTITMRLGFFRKM